MLRDLRGKKKKVLVKPDEVFQSGGITMARYGRFLMTKNDRTPVEHKAFKAQMAKDFPEYCKEIDGIILSIRKQVQKFNPLTLLQCGYFDYVRLLMGKVSESDYGMEEMIAQRMLDYIQSVIVSTPGPYSTSDDFDQEAWEKLYETIKSLYGKLTPWFQIARSAFLEANNDDYNAEYDSLYVQAEMLWLTVRGDRYLVHDIPHLHDLLAPHDKVFTELFGFTTKEFVKGMESIQSSLTFGLGQVLKEMREFQNKVLDGQTLRNSGKPEDEMRLLVKEASRKKEWRDCWESMTGRFFGLDLFDVGKVTELPTALLEQFSWGIGEEEEFFGPGDYSGWPLRLLPVSVRPFLRVEGKFYCFDLANLMDHIYRVMQRTITRMKPEYRERWNECQKAVSENIPLMLLARILPRANIYKSVYYEGPIGSGNKTGWCEVDGLVICDDHLIVAEVKAGAFTYTAPTGDFNAYINSVKSLILKPAEQASRFVQLLNTKGKVEVFDDREGRRIDTITKNKFRQITPCCITIDNLTELAARADKLGGIGVVVPSGVWCTSVNDLRVYADLFSSSVIFTHFLEQRSKATVEKTVDLWDELDHLGLYFEHNLYVQYIKGLVADLRADYINWHGYRKKIDEYYYMLMAEPKNAVKPGQEQMKGYFAKTIELIGVSEKPGRCKAASYILDMSGQSRDAFNSMIAEVLSKQDERRSIIPGSLFGGRVALTAFCHSRGTDLPTRRWTQEYALKRMLIAREKAWLSLILTFSTGHVLTGVDFEHLGEKNIPVDRRAWLEREAKTMQKREVEKVVAERGRIGRNELCPCGSGKKYKRCCGN